MALEVRLVPMLSDNYAYLLRDHATGETAIVDPAEAKPMLAALADTGWSAPRQIINTHHHADHVAGNAEIATATGAIVVGPESERAKIATLRVGLKDGDTIKVGDTILRAIATPGHTLGQLSYYAEDGHLLFSGDTLFALGCGRVFEGTMEQMWQSLLRLRDLPDETMIYCGHEYTQSNCRFALTIEPDNLALKARADEIGRMRGAGSPTIPSRLGDERATNPFLRADVPALQQAIGMDGASGGAVFAEVRKRKDKG